MLTAILSYGDVPLVFALLSALLFVASRLGFRLAARSKFPVGNQTGTVESSLLGLVGLLLGFTMSMAISRYDHRKEAVLEEANAVGTLYLRTTLLPQDMVEPSQKLILRYIDDRIDFFRQGAPRNRLVEARQRARKVQTELWSIAQVAAKTQPSPITALYVDALNRMIDLDEVRVTAALNNIPEIVLWALIALAFVALTVVGYCAGRDDRLTALEAWIVPLVIAVVLTLVVDIDRPTRGLVQTGQGSMERLKESLGNR